MADQPVPPPTANAHFDRIRVTVRNRKKIIFDDYVTALTSRNDSGTFDVLPEHSNFISVLRDSITLHLVDGRKIKILLKNGLIKVKDNAIKCYIDLLTANPTQ